MGSIREMLNPKTIALIGATEREGSLGRAILENLLTYPDGKIFPVNPNRSAVLGLECLPRVTDVPRRLSLAIVATPAATVPEILDQCGQREVQGAIIISAGFREAGEEGKRLEGRIAAVRRKYGMRIIGPNCMGVVRPHIGLNATFLKTNPKPGNIAFISQSGNLGDAIMEWGADAGIGFSMSASLGSMVDIGFGDLIDYLSDDYLTKSIMIYMESVGDARRFVSAARAFCQSKPIVVLKSGYSAQGACAMASRTGLEMADDGVYDAVFKRVGVVRVKRVAEMFNTAGVLDSRRLPRGPRLAIVTNAGGVGIIAADALCDAEGQTAELSQGSIGALDSLLPLGWSRNNPVDILGEADVDRYKEAIDICLKDQGVDGVLVIYTPRAIADAVELAEVLAGIARRTPKPVLAAWMGGRKAREGRQLLLKSDVPAYETPEEAIDTYLYMYRYKKNIQLLYETPEEVPEILPGLKNHLKAIVRTTDVTEEKQRILSTEQSIRFLNSYRIPVAKTFVVHHVDEALRKAHEMDTPIILKGRSLGRDSGEKGVTIEGIASDQALHEAFRELSDRTGQGAPDPGAWEMIVQEAQEGIVYEIRLELKRDRDFGSVIFLGLEGGKKGKAPAVSIGLPPLNQTLARRLLEESEIYSLIGNQTTEELSLLRKLEDVLLAFSNLIVDFPEIEEVELAPVGISATDVLVLDARFVVDRNYSASSQYPHLVIAPYPRRYIMPWTLPDGTEVLLRPIRPEDEPLGRDLFASLSEETIRVRFLSPMEITHEFLVRFCNIDYDRQIAILAEVKADGKRKIIGGVRLVGEPDSKRGEFAILVHESYQGKGLGMKLMDIAIGIGQENRLEEIYGLVLTENEKMLKLCQRLGFEVSILPDGISRVTLRLR